ncbi:Hypothetical protein SMAX5B_005628 [Scophthalmus maximus]|uniref:Uncharacterized protein n=1 Tax=Scophthalmus maximus TaxID=52904 RepID=A0A2U9BBC0_SCOMX|nr:Hypothetical protein SMAX5B_005628 [Scophthalmus maximus]KAF0042911.1 hypothetical protein F2P81_004248 [Scophthalmus maximus]
MAALKLNLQQHARRARNIPPGGTRSIGHGHILDSSAFPEEQGGQVQNHVVTSDRRKRKAGIGRSTVHVRRGAHEMSLTFVLHADPLQDSSTSHGNTLTTQRFQRT